jgi:hypothetical protein
MKAIGSHRTLTIALVLTAASAMPGCGGMRLGEQDRPPSWRRPSPAMLEPLERYVVPDDGFLDHLAKRGPGANGAPAA